MNRLALCLLLLASAASAQVVDTSVCDVLANPVSFDGKIVRLTAVTVIAGFDEFVIDGSGCKPGGAIWLAYPENTKAKSGPAGFVRLQLAKNSPAAANAPKRTLVTLQKNGDFARFDSLLATPHKSSAQCLGCSRYTVTATLTGRLDGASNAGLVRDAAGKVTGLDGFGNLNLYRARLVLQAVSDVVQHDVTNIRKPGTPPTADQVQKAAAAFGEEGEDNGVMVGFGPSSEVADEGIKGDASSPDGVLFHVTLDMKRLGKNLLSKAIAHMGTHIADIRDARAQGVDEAEARAWPVTFAAP